MDFKGVCRARSYTSEVHHRGFPKELETVFVCPAGKINRMQNGQRFHAVGRKWVHQDSMAGDRKEAQKIQRGLYASLHLRGVSHSAVIMRRWHLRTCQNINSMWAASFIGCGLCSISSSQKRAWPTWCSVPIYRLEWMSEAGDMGLLWKPKQDKTQ